MTMQRSFVFEKTKVNRTFYRRKLVKQNTSSKTIINNPVCFPLQVFGTALARYSSKASWYYYIIRGVDNQQKKLTGLWRQLSCSLPMTDNTRRLWRHKAILFCQTYCYGLGTIHVITTCSGWGWGRKGRDKWVAGFSPLIFCKYLKRTTSEILSRFPCSDLEVHYETSNFKYIFKIGEGHRFLGRAFYNL